MNKLLTLVDKDVNKGYFRWLRLLWIAGAISWWGLMVFVLYSKFTHEPPTRGYIVYDENGIILEKHESVDTAAIVAEALHPYMIAWYAFMILTPFLVKWIGQWIYKAVRKKKEQQMTLKKVK